jgi:hypothetical protein
MGPDTDVCTRIAEIVASDQGELYVTCFGTEEMLYNKEEVLRVLGPGWALVPVPVPMPRPDEEDLGDPNAN